MFFYNLGIFFYRLMIALASPFHPKAAKMLSGRKNLFEKLKIVSEQKGNHKLAWFHVASLGEFEQGRPVIEKLKEKNPEIKILLTFFSPSGFEMRKDYDKADFIFYIPFDFPSNVKKFLDVVKPDIAVFIKYEFWLNFLNGLNKRQIPVYLVSAVFHPAQPFFRWYGNRFIAALHSYKHIFVQDKNSFDLLQTIKIKNKSISGDTRFDRVLEIASHPKEINGVAGFSKDHLIIIAGSSWEKDEELLIKAFARLKSEGKKIKLIFAPHEIHAEHIAQLKKNIAGNNLSFSVFTEGISETNEILIVDTMGMLSSLYQYGNIAFIGGGFRDGIHNILEAAVYGMPVFFGPNYYKFSEAHAMIADGTAFAIEDENELYTKLKSLMDSPEELKKLSESAALFVKSSAGASQMVIDNIQWP